MNPKYLLLPLSIFSLLLTQCAPTPVSEKSLVAEPTQVQTATAESPTPTSTPSNTPAPSPTPSPPPSPTATHTASITPTPSPTPTVIGGYPGRYLLKETDESGENHILSLREADGTLIQVNYSFPRVTEIVAYGATSPRNAFGEVAWSPNGQVYALQTCGYREDPSGGSERWLCDLNLYTPDGSPILAQPKTCRNDVDWSPDGEWLAYTAVTENGSREVHLLKSDGSQERTLAAGSTDSAYPLFSPDGSQILYWATGGSLRVIHLDGSGERLIDNSWWGTDSFSWSPDGSQVAYSHRDNNLYAKPVDGPLRTLIYDDAHYRLFGPRFSPDGGSILFDALSPKIGRCFYVMPLDRSAQPRLVGSGWDARWSPDGAYIFLQGWPLHSEQSDPLSYYEAAFYAINADASGYLALRDGDIGLVRGAWQPGTSAGRTYVIEPLNSYRAPENWSPDSFPKPEVLSEFEGIWVNQDPDAMITARIEIRSHGEAILVRMWGVCSSEPCYWGEIATSLDDLEDRILQVTWDFGWSRKEVELHWISPARLEVLQHTQYLDDSGRTDRTNRESFMRIAGQPSRDPINTCPPVLGHYNPLDFPYPQSLDAGSVESPALLPTPAPTWASFERPPSYDAFEGERMLTSRWHIPEDLGDFFEIEQQNGALSFASRPETEQHHSYLDYPDLEFPTRQDHWVYQARLRILSTRSFGVVGLTAVAPFEDGWWGVHCKLERSPWFSPGNAFTCQYNMLEHTSKRIPIQLNTWYTLRMEFNRAYGAFQVYLDGELVDTFTPLDAENLKDLPFYPKLHIGVYEPPDEDSPFEAQVDEVWITRP